MRKPVYVIVTPFYPSPREWQGAFCHDFAKAVAKTGRFDVRVFKPGRFSAYEYDGMRVAAFDEKMLPSAVFPFAFACRNARRFLAALAREGIDMRDVAVCHAHTAFFGIYPLALKKKTASCLSLLHHHDPQSFGLNLGALRHFPPYNMVQFPLLRKMHEAIDMHVFISSMVEKSFRSAPDASWTDYADYRRQMRWLGAFRPARIRRSCVLHNGVDVSRFSPAPPGAVRDGVFTIGCIGNFAVWKDQITLLRAAALMRADGIRNFRIRFVGSGPCLAECRRFASENGLDGIVSFEKECDHTRLPDFYRSLDLFALPSFFEGFGCVLTEAFACGVPFVTCEGQGMDDLVPPHERGRRLVPPRNPVALAEAIVRQMRDPAPQTLAGEIAIRPLVERFLDAVDRGRAGLSARASGA